MTRRAGAGNFFRKNAVPPDLAAQAGNRVGLVFTRGGP